MAAELSRSVPVTRDFAGGMYQWSGAGDMMYRWGVNRVKGRLEVCGLMSSRGGGDYVSLNIEVLRAARITVKGETVLRDLSFFNIVSHAGRRTNHEGEEAHCVLTEVPFPPSLRQIDMKIRPGPYRVDD